MSSSQFYQLPLTYDVRFDWNAGAQGETWAVLLLDDQVIWSTSKLAIQSDDAETEIEEVRRMLLNHARECLARVFE